MNKIVLISSFLLSGLFSSAQLNLDFEKWDVNYNGVDEVKNWVNTADATKYDAPATLFKVTENPFSGLASLKLTTAYWNAGTAYKLDTLVGSLLQQITYSKRPSSFQFSYKSYPQLGDEILVGVQLTTTLNDELIVIGEGYFTSSKTENSWVNKEVVIDYYTNDTPDNINIMALSSANAVISNGNHGYAKIGSTLFLDNLKLKVSENAMATAQSSIKVFPNPAKEYIIVESSFKNQTIKIYSLNGKLMMSSDLNQRSKIDISKLPSGTYIYKVFSKNSETISASNKFNVVR